MGDFKLRDAYYEGSRTIEHYQKFLTLWKDADPGIAEVEDARKMLAGLKEEEEYILLAFFLKYIIIMTIN